MQQPEIKHSKQIEEQEQLKGQLEDMVRTQVQVEEVVLVQELLVKECQVILQVNVNKV